MAMKVYERERDGVVVLELHGTAERTDPPLQERVDRLIAQGKRNIVLHLANVPYSSSSDIGAYVSCYLKCKRAGGALKLAAVTKSARVLLVMSHLDTIMEMYNTEEEALASFASAAADSSPGIA